MKLTLELPETTPLLDLDDCLLKEALIATFYHIGSLSEKEACQALNLDRRAFEEILPRFSFSVLADDSETINTELCA